MQLGADMMGDDADDAFAIGHQKLLSRIGLSVNEPLGPEPPIRVEHDLDVCGVLLNLTIADPNALRNMHAPREADSYC